MMSWRWWRRPDGAGGAVPPPGGTSRSGVAALADDLFRRALSLVAQGAPRGRTPRLADDVGARLYSEDYPRNGWLDGGVWAWPVYRKVADSAARVYRTAVGGDEEQ
jgi:hypothetical protein